MSDIVPVTLREIYPSVGDYNAKFLIKPSVAVTVTGYSVVMKDSDGRLIESCNAKRWGTKLNIDFTIDENVPDGVAIVEITLKTGRDRTICEKFDLWVIK